MKRPLCVIGLAFALAVRAAFSVVEQPERMLPLALAAGLTGVLLILLSTRAMRLRAGALAALAASAGFCACWIYTARSLAPFEEAAGKVVEMQGLVEEAVYQPTGVRYTVRVDFPGETGLPNRQRLTIRHYGERELAPGDCFSTRVRLEPLSTGATYARSVGIRANAYPQEELVREQLEGYRWHRRLLQLRRLLRFQLEQALPQETAGMAAAMALGQQDAIPNQVYDDLARSGVVHLVAVSGLHLSVLSGALLWVLERARLSRGKATLITLLACLAFAGIVGFSASVVRSLVMLALLLLARLIGRSNDSINSLGFALLLICMLWPHWTLGRGIWLSFSATLGILLLGQPLAQGLLARYRPVHPWVDRPCKGILAALGIGLGAYLFTLPLQYLYYGWISLVAPLANVAVSPFVALALVGSLLCALLGGAAVARPAAWVAQACLKIIMEVARVAGGISLATIPLDQAWLLIWLAFAALVGLLLVWGGKDRRLLPYGAVLCVLVFAVGQLSHQAAARNKVEVVTLEGCGPALLLRQKQAVVLGSPSPYEAAVLEKYLRHRGVKGITAVIATDCGEQVGSGLPALGQRYEIGCVVGPNDDYIVAELAQSLPGVPVYPGGYASVWALDGVAITTEPTGPDLRLRIGESTLLKTGREYAIMESGNDAGIFAGGVLVPEEGRAPVLTPVGTELFGETRMLMELAP